VAQEMGKGLGGREILLGPVPQIQGQGVIFIAIETVPQDFQEIPKATGLVS
jgi:hypothetical protein